MKKVVYTTIDKEVLEEWQKLWALSPYANYTNAPQWFLSVIEAFAYKKFVIIAIYKNEKLAAVGALTKQKKYGIDCYTVTPGDFIYGNPFLIDLEDKELVSEFTNALVEIGTVFLDNLTEDVVSAFGRNNKTQAIEESLNYSLPIIKDDKDVAIIKNRKILLRRIRNNAECFSFKSYEGTSSKLSEVFAIDTQSRKKGNGYSTFADEQTKRFFQLLAKHFSENLRINILYYTDTPIAYEIGFLINDTYYANQIAYLSEYMQYSPGKVIAVKLIDYLASKNVKNLNLGSGDSHIKRLLTDEYKQLYQCIISNNSLAKKYLKSSFKLRNNAFNLLSKNVVLYATYRKAKGK